MMTVHRKPKSWHVKLRVGLFAALFLLVGESVADESKSRNELVIYRAQSGQATTLLIHGTADISAMGPVIQGFQSEFRDVEVHYRLYQTVPLYQDAVSQSDEKSVADLLVSSAMDLQVKLANDGYVQPAFINARGLPDWAIWRDQIFGFTLEPAVIMYNSDVLHPDEIPKSHQDLIRLLERSPDRFRGRVATYDIGVSGVGYMFATTESMLSANFWRLAHALGTVKAQLFCCTEDMIASLIRGDTFIAYDVLGSYALRHIRVQPNLRIVLPEDYVVAAARTVVIPRKATHPALAKKFVNYVLSETGQAIVAEAFGLSVTGLGIDREQMKTRYVADKPGVLSFPTLGLPALTYLDRIKREQFVKAWRQIVSP
jgi:two-component system sensor histidine kinase TctE